MFNQKDRIKKFLNTIEDISDSDRDNRDTREKYIIHLLTI